MLAYRKGGSTNIHHAKSLFDEIDTRQDCAVFALDISGFFDCLDHKHLKSEILGLLGEQRLTGHHWTVFNNVTRYSWVETEDLDYVFGQKRMRRGRICTPKDFKKHVRGRKAGLVRKHDRIYGIPQGTPISGLYANIFLRTFDREMSALVSQCGGSYRRYSDDIAIVLPIGQKERHVIACVEKYLADYLLALSAEKTETAEYLNGVLRSNKPIQYLGFTYDGHETLIRASSLDAYRLKMKSGIHAKLVAAKQNDITSDKVYKREALAKYTHMGERRNFIKYAYLASKIMEAPEIKVQVKDHLKWFNRAWGREIKNVYGHVVSDA